MPFSAYPGLLGSDVRTVLEECLLTCTSNLYFPASGYSKRPWRAVNPWLQAHSTVELERWPKLLLQQLSVVQPGLWDVSPKNNQIPSAF